MVANAIRAEQSTAMTRSSTRCTRTWSSTLCPVPMMLRTALDQMRSIRSGKEDHAILTFNSVPTKELKEAIKRGAELSLNVLTETRSA